MIYFVVDRAGAFTMRDFVELHAPALAPHVAFVFYEDLPSLTTLSSGTYIFAALDQLTARGTRFVREMIDVLRAPASSSRVLNDPNRVLLRYELLSTLQAKGLNAHGVVRATDRLPNVRFPVFVREESQHNGAITPLLGAREELERSLGRSVLRGYRLSDLLVVEYHETGDANGRYHRYSAFLVGDTVVAREFMVGDEWMLKSHGNAPTEAEIDAELAYVLENPHANAIREIFSVAGIDYGRIDYAIANGRIETWEINTNPTIRRGRQTDPVPIPEAINRLRDPMRAHFTKTFAEALLAYDVGSPPRAIPFHASDTVRRSAEPMIRSEGIPWLRRAASIVRPALPYLKRVIDVVSPVVSRTVKQFGGR